MRTVRIKTDEDGDVMRIRGVVTGGWSNPRLARNSRYDVVVSKNKHGHWQARINCCDICGINLVNIRNEEVEICEPIFRVLVGKANIVIGARYSIKVTKVKA